MDSLATTDNLAKLSLVGKKSKSSTWAPFDLRIAKVETNEEWHQVEIWFKIFVVVSFFVVVAVVIVFVTVVVVVVVAVVIVDVVVVVVVIVIFLPFDVWQKKQISRS